MAQKISVVIPNYNGQNLLLKHLPNVLKYSSGCEIIVVDDASSDDSVKIIHKKFKKIKLIRLKKNSGFSNAVNSGIKAASGDFVVLLNTDVSPRSNYLKPAINHFKNNKLFAVGFLDYSHENKSLILKGKGNGFFKKGFILHSGANIERGQTFWVSGGSGIFDKNKLLSLKGFDKIYSPFYWEDIDLCFRAARSGYVCFFEPLSVVDHYHEQGSILKQKSKFIIKSVAYKNQFIFFWKNVEDIYMVCLHMFWLPYHLANAIIRLDLPFVFGLLWAIFTIPRLILNDIERTQDYFVSTKEILKKFEK